METQQKVIIGIVLVIICSILISTSIGIALMNKTTTPQSTTQPPITTPEPTTSQPTTTTPQSTSTSTPEQIPETTQQPQVSDTQPVCEPPANPTDKGYSDKKRGYFDALQNGCKNAYCRWVGNNPDLWFSCAIPGQSQYSPKGKYTEDMPQFQ